MFFRRNIKILKGAKRKSLSFCRTTPPLATSETATRVVALDKIFLFFTLRGVCVGVWNGLQAGLFESIFYLWRTSCLRWCGEWRLIHKPARHSLVSVNAHDVTPSLKFEPESLLYILLYRIIEAISVSREGLIQPIRQFFNSLGKPRQLPANLDLLWKLVWQRAHSSPFPVRRNRGTNQKRWGGLYTMTTAQPATVKQILYITKMDAAVEHHSFESAIASVLSNLKYPFRYKPEQRTTLKAFMSKKDVIAVLPTGFGESLISQCGEQDDRAEGRERTAWVRPVSISHGGAEA